MTKVIEALPGKVILIFPEKATEKKGLLYIPTRSQRRVELARLVSVGDYTSPEERIRRQGILDANEGGRLFAVPVAAGTMLYQIELGGPEEADDVTGLGDWAWLKWVRIYAMSQIGATVPDPGNLEFAKIPGGA